MLFVGIGGVLGAISRFLLGQWITKKTPDTFPFGTWIINISGSFALGVLVVLHLDHTIPDWLWLLLAPGFLGAYTTFSTFGYEVIHMMEQKDTRRTAIYIVTSVLLGIISASIGGLIGNVLFLIYTNTCIRL